jgi:hypothetical protein
VFAGVPFERWLTEAPSQQIPWKVRMSPGKLSPHQRLEASIEVRVPGPELLKRKQDEHVLLLLQVKDEAGAQYRNFGYLEASDFRPELGKADVTFTWQAFVVPGKYEVAVALVDKASDEHNFTRSTWHVDRMKKDPLPDAWKDLPSVEFWSPEAHNLDELYRSDIDGHLHLPLAASRRVHLEILADLTPSDLFAGNQKLYENYLGGVLPMVKALSQIRMPSGSTDVAGLDLYQSKVIFEQHDAAELDWPQLKVALAPDKGPAVVHVNTLQQREHSPVFLREEIARRLKAPGQAAPGEASDPLVFIVIGQNMDLYTFPHLSAMVEDKHCAVFYLQYGVSGTERDGLRTRRLDGILVNLGPLFGDAEKVVRLLQPLPVRTFQVRSPESFRQALARILEEVSHM